MKDSQRWFYRYNSIHKYIKANNERFSTSKTRAEIVVLSISRRIMKDSQPFVCLLYLGAKYIKANNERFSTVDFDTIERA